MTDYENYEDQPAATDVDRRVVAVQRFVDLERAFNGIRRDIEQRQKKAAAVAEELEVARQELHGLLGLPTSGVKAMTGEEAKRLTKERLDDFYGGAR